MKPKKTTRQNAVIEAWNENNPEIPSDVLGSYTGTPSSSNGSEQTERPVQDADDL